MQSLQISICNMGWTVSGVLGVRYWFPDMLSEMHFCGKSCMQPGSRPV